MAINKKNFTPETIEKIIERYTDKHGVMRCGACDDSGGGFEAIPHHIFFKSQLFRDCVSHEYNGVVIHQECHRFIHHGTNDEETTRGKEIDKKLKREAIRAFKGIIPEQDYEELCAIYRGRGYGKIDT